MAAPMGLNPLAPDYIPLSYKRAPYTDIPPLLDLSIAPAFSSSAAHFCYASPPPPPYFATSQSPLQTEPLYTTSSYPIQPHHRNLLPPPPPPPVVEPPPAVGMAEQPHEVVTERVEHRAPRRSRGLVRGGFYGRAGKIEGFLHHQKEANLAWRRKFGNGDDQEQLHRKVESRLFLKKHQVLPLRCKEEKTTVMIKNIPKEYNRELLLKFLDEHCKLENRKNKFKNSHGEAKDDTVSAFDFMYLPMDFRTGCSRGYAFVNFTDPRAVWKFYNACNRKTWDFFQSPKIREIVCAKIQGKGALVKHFEKSTFWCGSDDFLPVCFSPPRDGSGELVEESTVGKRIATSTPYWDSHSVTQNHQI